MSRWGREERTEQAVGLRQGGARQCGRPSGKGLGHVSARAEDGDMHPSGALAVPGLAYLLSSQPSYLARNPVLKTPGPR